MYNFHISKVLEFQSDWRFNIKIQNKILFVIFVFRDANWRFKNQDLKLPRQCVYFAIFWVNWSVQSCTKHQVPRLPGECPDDEHCVWCITVECYEQYHLICSSKLPLQIGSVDELIFPMLGFWCKLYYRVKLFTLHHNTIFHRSALPLCSLDPENVSPLPGRLNDELSG